MALDDSPPVRMWGRYEHSLDEKGRVIVPAAFRDKLGEEFVLTTGTDHHLRIYTMPVWRAMEEQLVSVSVYDEQDQNLTFLQRMFGNCEFSSLDQQNRLTVPRYMRDWADLRENEPAIIIGSGTRLEIWSRANWNRYSGTFNAANASVAAAGRKTDNTLSAGLNSPSRPTTITVEGPQGA